MADSSVLKTHNLALHTTSETFKNLYALGEHPPVGYVPPQMYAWVLRRERYGEPASAYQMEVLDVPEPAADEVLIYVMAAGINYNGVWAARGLPIDIIQQHQKQGGKENFHIGGSDTSGIVYKVGKNVTNVSVGDRVVAYSGCWDASAPEVKAGEDPLYSPTFCAWGYETNWGSFAQFALLKDYQCLPKPEHLSWAEAACYLVSSATAYRMLYNWGANSLREGNVVLIWGGAGGLGSQAIQIARAARAIPVAVVSDSSKVEYCMRLGAQGCIDRTHFDHWGVLPDASDTQAYNRWLKGVRAFGKAIWEIVGEQKNPRIVFEHPGEDTLPTSLFVCDTSGMVVICGGTSGYNGSLDLRYLWMRQKRLQGSHYANLEQARAANQLIIEGVLNPCLAKVFEWEQLPEAHQAMYENRHPSGNMAILVGASNDVRSGQASTE
jgi:crotonyl-CoA carboxylase/reductase